MDSDSDEEKYYASEDTKNDELCPPSRQSSISESPSPDFSSYISQTIIGMELTEQMTDCGKYETYLKL